MVNKFEIYFDGSCLNNGTGYNPMGIGVAIFKNGERYRQSIRCAGFGTNNDAEWVACTDAFELGLWLIDEEGGTLKLYSDSQTVVNQVKELYRVREQKFKIHKEKADKHIAILGNRYLGIEWIAREKNKWADYLSKQGSSILK